MANQIKCEFCNETINSRGLAAHLHSHGKTIQDNTLARLKKTPSDIPPCRFCGAPVRVLVDGFSEICASPKCKAQLTHIHKSEQVHRQQLALAKAGKHRFQSRNLDRDADGKSIKHIRLAQAQVSRGVHPLQKQNRPKTETGKDLYIHNSNIKRYSGRVKHAELFTKEYLIANFVKDGRFLIADCMDFFNYSYPTVNRFKIKCGITAPNKRSNEHVQQAEVVSYIKSIYSGLVIENCHTLIQGREVDIYLPEKNLAIEFDGLMFHSIGLGFPACTDDRLLTYHKEKTDLCEKEGVQLLHIFENEWIEKRAIWESVIASKLGIYQKTIHARACEIQELSNQFDFLTENHLQGPVSAKVSLGLFFHGQLVSLMTFGKPRFSKKCNWELLRFCSLKHHHVPGAASRLLTYFRSHYSGSIVSYANRRWSDGKLYRALGFTLDGESEPCYYYFKADDFVLSHRSAFQKHKLHKILKDFDPNLTETDNMLANGYRKIYDCGNLVFVLS